MKKTLTITVAAILASAAFFGCTKSGSTSPGYSMKATINGSAFNGTNCVAQESGTALNIDGGVFTGSVAVYPYILITLSNYTGAGTYTIPGTISATNGAAIDSNTTSSAVSVYGTVTITATSPNIVGTFSFTGLDSTKVTSGTFTAKAP